jgi:Xaa-Pro aminopeptidase
METLSVKDRINSLRNVMNSHGIQAYIVCTEDFHGSEYVGGYFKAREYLSGFTGSAGTLLVTEENALLWTDGRYFIQAAEQLKGSSIALMKSGEKDVPTLAEYLGKNLAEGSVVGFDGRTVSTKMFWQLAKKLAAKKVTFAVDSDLAGLVWESRPPLSAEPVWELSTEFSGETRAEKLSRVRAKMSENNADFLALSALDEIAWLLNLRGNDVLFNPVFLSYMIIDKNKAQLFAKKEIFDENIVKALAEDNVEIKDYDSFYNALESLESGSAVMLDPAKVNCLITRSAAKNASVIERESPIMLMKSVKNPVEQENIRRAHIKDGAAVTKFMYWLKYTDEKITEISAAEKLEEFRKMQSGYLGQSFEPIMAYGANAAIVHYSATEETNTTIERRGLLLSDTGGHYLEGTTDITRTYVLGELTDEEKRGFTLVLAGHLDLAAAVFPKGTRGANLDILAREPLWREGLDFNHGTGHGVGYLLNVHEGPNRIHWRLKGNVGSEILPGTVTSDEPGLYIEGKFGIRHESLVLCREREDGFLYFDTLTLVPFDLDGVDKRYLSDREIKLLNAYHERVYKEIAPYLDEKEKEWLKTATRAI